MREREHPYLPHTACCAAIHERHSSASTNTNWLNVVDAEMYVVLGDVSARAF
jgi:hypothetical protein